MLLFLAPVVMSVRLSVELKFNTHTFVVYLLKTPIKTIGKLCSLYSNNNIESRDVSDVKINHGFLHLIGRWRCSALSRKTACKCITASNLALIHDFSSRFD